MTLTWKRSVPTIGAPQYNGYQGDVLVYSIKETMFETDKPYRLVSFLPGQTTLLGTGDLEELKDKAEGMFVDWLNRASLEQVKA